MTEKMFDLAKERYEALGVNVEAALEELRKIQISLHCWQGDDIRGFEDPDFEVGGGACGDGELPRSSADP